MGKKKITILGSEQEEQLKVKKAVKLQQKKLREGKEVKKDQIVTEATSPEPISAPVQPADTQSAKKTKTQRSRSKNYLQAKSKVNQSTYSLTEGLKLLRLVSLAKFDPAVELHITLKEKISPQVVDLPHTTGKTRRIAVATDEVVAEIESGKINFDVLLATPAQMAKLVKLAKILGPKGLMPNPKTGTIVNDPEALVKSMNSKNSITLKTEKDAPLVHLRLGKLSQPDSELEANIQAVKTALSGKQIKKITLKSSISPAIKLSF